MVPLRSILTLAVSISALVFVAWMASVSLGSDSLYPDPQVAAVQPADHALSG